MKEWRGEVGMEGKKGEKGEKGAGDDAGEVSREIGTK